MDGVVSPDYRPFSRLDMGVSPDYRCIGQGG